MLATAVVTLMAACGVGLVLDPAGSNLQAILAGIELPYFEPRIPFFPVFTWYGFSYVVGFTTGYYLLQALRKRGLNPIGKEQLLELTFWLIVFIAISGKMGFWVLYPTREVLDQLTHINNFSDVYAVMFGGGRSFHASLVGVLLACLFLSWKWKLSTLWLTDLVCVVAAPGLFFGRLGNFINQELWGMKTSGELPWSMKFFSEAMVQGQKTIRPLVDSALQASTQPATASASTIAIQMPDVSDKVWANYIQLASRSFDPNLSMPDRQAVDRQLTELMTNYPVLQNVARQIRDITFQYVHTNIMPSIPYRHPSQLYNALGEGLLLFLILWLFRTKLIEKKGFLTGVFMVGYGMIRFCLEYFREPDRLAANELPYRWMGMLSLGQIYCLVMILAGIAFLLYARAKGTLSATDRRRVEWARTGDEENPPAETYPPGRTPRSAKPLADKIATYQKALDHKCFINKDGSVGSAMKGKEVNALKAVLPKLRELQAKWAPG